mmetsp:Transcript_12789/g.51313  ORF Transcript_12789/g.51313 Transcript_12789/m.51313 type:complete len:204 (+) Transcript_12789:689-1300(+)
MRWTCTKERSRRCIMAIVLVAKSLGASLWKSRSNNSGTTKVAKPRRPGRSRPRPSCTTARASGARWSENVSNAPRPVGAAVSASSKATTSSSAVLAPSPKYGLTVCAASPKSTTRSPPATSESATYRNLGSVDGAASAIAATVASSTSPENCGSSASSNFRVSSGDACGAASGSFRFMRRTPQYALSRVAGSASKLSRFVLAE